MTTMEKQSFDHDLFYKGSPELICPNCQENIPILTLYYSAKGQMTVRLNCYCYRESSIMSLHDFIDQMIKMEPELPPPCFRHKPRAELYCIECERWLCQECLHLEFTSNHTFIKYQVRANCYPHKASFLFYCRNCNLNVCPKCKKEHENHKVVPISTLEPKHLQSNRCNEIITMNKEKAYAFIAKIERKSQFRLSKEIQSALSINESINENLKVLYQLIMKLSYQLASYPLYSVMKMQQPMVFNPIEFNDEGLSIEEEGKLLKEYLETQFILTPTTTIECNDVLIGHSNRVLCLFALRDDRIASGSADTTIRLWDIVTNECKATLKGHSDSVCCLVELKDGSLASGSADNTIRIWNTASIECKGILKGHSDQVFCLVELNDGRLASGSRDNAIKLWSVDKNKCLASLTGHEDWVLCLVKLNDGRLASGSRDMSIRLWDTTTNKSITSLIGHDNSVLCLIELDNGTLASSSGDKTIKLWNVTTNECHSTLKGHSHIINCLIQLKNGMLLSGSDDMTLKLCNVTEKVCIITLTGHPSVFNCLIELKDGRLASASGSNMTMLLDIDVFQPQP